MEPTTSTSIPGAKCCCGSEECAFLAHNSKLLAGLERDVSKAAQLGQALLIRHETYVADSERERQQMLASIENLEKEKLELEAKNAETIKANRDLLDELEQLNNAVAHSDSQIQALTDTLHATEEEIQRLSSLAARTQNLERQLIDLEREQSLLQNSLDLKVGDERTAVQRWKRAEKMILDLQDQIDRIEKEAREEKERHVEIVTRMERRMAVDGELATAATRLKVKAGHEKPGTNVVSHFVKDILVDNANLQHGILELREMLLNSNEEVERLREQLKDHQPVHPDEEAVTPRPNLQTELGPDPIANPEVHIHHHYHGATGAKNLSKAQPSRRPRKKRISLTSGLFPSALASTPTPASEPTSASTILSQTSATIPNSNRWSNATTLAPPSLPSSPLSMSHRGSIYDRVFSDVAYDSSRPTSPSDSLDIQSPMFDPVKVKEWGQDDIIKHRRRKSQSLKPPSLTTIRSVSTPISMTTKSSPATAIISAVSPANSFTSDYLTRSPAIPPQPHSAIPEENEDSTLSTLEQQSLSTPDETDADELVSPLTQIQPKLRRAASHESLISVSGMDIHTLQSRPSQLLFSSSPAGAGSIQPELTPWTATAHASMSRRNLDSSTLNRSLLYSTIANQKRGVSGSSTKSEGLGSGLGLGKKVGGWVFGKWGATPAPTSSSPSSPNPSSSSSSFSTVAPSTTTPRPVSATSEQTQSSVDTAPTKSDTLATPTPQPSTPDPSSSSSSTTKKKQKDASTMQMRLRPAGVNQSGPIWGFFDVPPTPTKVIVTELDSEALGEALQE